MSKIKELEIELAEIQDEIGQLKAELAVEEQYDRVDWYLREIKQLEAEASDIMEEIRYLEIEGEW